MQRLHRSMTAGWRGIATQASGHERLDGRVWTERRAHQLYARLCNQAKWSWLWSALTGRTRHLLDLASAEATCTVHDRRHTGLQMVPIDRIRGSEGRSNEFDRDFCPLWDYTKERWLNIAVLRQQGKALPPVELVQIGEVYFCIDGHHRISVARALGEREIEAQVTVWQVVGGVALNNEADKPQLDRCPDSRT